MRKIKVVVLLVQQLQHGFTKNAKVSPNLTVAHIQLSELGRRGEYANVKASKQHGFEPGLSRLRVLFSIADLLSTRSNAFSCQ